MRNLHRQGRVKLDLEGIHYPARTASGLPLPRPTQRKRSAHYTNKDVLLLQEFVKKANKTIRPLYYPLKSLSRYGEMGSVFIKELVVQLRRTYLSHIEDYAMNENFCDADILPALYKVNSDIIELYLNNKEQLKKIATETNNNVLEDTLGSFDTIISANNVVHL